jgi:hypothetical protein
MAHVQTFEVDEKLAAVNVGQETVYADKCLKSDQLSTQPFF